MKVKLEIVKKKIAMKNTKVVPQKGFDSIVITAIESSDSFTNSVTTNLQFVFNENEGVLFTLVCYNIR